MSSPFVHTPVVAILREQLVGLTPEEIGVKTAVLHGV
jgi:hypothetical protein